MSDDKHPCASGCSCDACVRARADIERALAALPAGAARCRLLTPIFDSCYDEWERLLDQQEQAEADTSPRYYLRRLLREGIAARLTPAEWERLAHALSASADLNLDLASCIKKGSLEEFGSILAKAVASCDAGWLVRTALRAAGVDPNDDAAVERFNATFTFDRERAS